MASEAPDPRTFKGWEDAFKYPIPVVRKLEQQLRGNAGENREKLRSLVGASYRDLLSTAETIIDMEDRMSSVESKVARISQNCNSRNVERISRNAGTIYTHNKSRDVGKYNFAAQLAVLRNCPVVMVRLMEKETGLLLPAKVLVISRLLHKALSQSSMKAEIVDNLRDRLGSLRRKLLRRIDKGLASGKANAAILVESMCAYSLATASTPTDVLRHFLHIRMEVINKSLRHESGLKEHGLAALKLCLQTCVDVQTIFPRRLADALFKLKSQPLVQDPDVRALYELNLDIHDRWIGDETRYYVPQPRHDELQRPEAEKLLHQWSKQAIPAFLKGIKEALEKTDDLKAVAELRQELIETWIVSGSRMAGVKSNNVLDDLRDTMNGQLEKIMQARTRALKHIVEDISKHLEHTASGEQTPDSSLWTTTSYATDLSNGAQSFKTTILNTHNGRNEPILRIVSSYDSWMQSILEVKSIVKTMKEMRWDDPFTDDVDIEDSDDEFGDSKQTLLSDDDPRLLEDTTRDALVASLHTLGEQLSKTAVEVTKEEGNQAVTKATFLLRIIREISDRIPQLRLNDRSKSLDNPFNSKLLRPLHTALAAQIVRANLSIYAKRLAAASKSRTKSHIIWEGNPPLPSQPSPTAFRFLQGLNKSMSELGSDLWAPDGVQVLKAIASEGLSNAWSVALAEASKVPDDTTLKQGDTNTKAEQGEESTTDVEPVTSQAPKSDIEDLRQQRLKQLFFDILYIQRFLSTSASSDLAASVKDEISSASHLDESGKNRLNDKAAEYGRKTYLLFALLA